MSSASTSPTDPYISIVPENIFPDFSAVEIAQIQDLDPCLWDKSGGNDRAVFVKKSHKADREKLRREKINEQFADLAAALDPDRPKNDKASILIESVQVVKELRAEVKRLQDEHSSLLNESRELTEEKNELRGEKAAIKSETEKLQDQFQQHFRTLSSWMVMEPTVMMSAASFPYPIAVPQAGPVPSANCQQPFASSQAQRPLVAPSPYVPLATIGAFPVHPVLHAYAAFGNRPGDGSNPYLNFPNCGASLNGQSHVERPYAQYPSQLHPMPPYITQMQPHQDPQGTVNSSSPEVPQPPASHPVSSPVPNQAQMIVASSPNLQSEGVDMGESSTVAVNCNSQVLATEMNEELLSSSSIEVRHASNSEVTELKGESKATANQGTREQVNEVTSEEGLHVGEAEKSVLDSEDN